MSVANQLEPEEGRNGEYWRNVRITTRLMQMLVEAAHGEGNIIDWGEPDAEGFYTPTVTISDATLGQVARAVS